MRRLAAGAILMALALHGVAAAAAPPSPSPRPEPTRKRLDLGLFGSPYGTPTREASDHLRFESWVEVIGDPKADPNETMLVWWKHFDFAEPAIYGRGYNVRRDGQPNGVNILPLLQKAYERIRKRK